MSIATLLIISTIVSLIALAGYLVARSSRKKRQKARITNSYWSIGYQTSNSPFDVSPETAAVYGRGQLPPDVHGVADPFLLERDGTIYLFYELIVNTSPAAKIAVSTYDQDNQAWNFHSVILDEPFHLSYPFVFEYGSEVYMIPETKKAGAVRLYRATDFPSKWEFEKNLIEDKKFVDSSIFCWQGNYYLFTSRKRKLYLYYSKSPTGDWKLHPRSPVKRWNYARCAGKIFEDDGRLFRFAQEQAKGYGMGLRRFEILELSTKDYKEVAVDSGLFFEPCGDSWAQHGMHHLDILKLTDNNYLSVFDGRGVKNT
jgi:hypothetical protein